MMKEEIKKYLTCVYCEKPLLDNDLVKDAYKMSVKIAWAHGRLKILADMLSDRGEAYISHQIREIIAEFEYLKV